MEQSTTPTPHPDRIVGFFLGQISGNSNAGNRRTGLKDRVRALTGGQGVDVIYDPVGGDLFDDCLRCVAWSGRILIIGFASGTIPDIPANLPLLKGSSIVGVFWGTFVQREVEVNLANMRELLAWFEQGKLKPCISRTYSLEDAPLAMNALAQRQASGKLVVTI